jgi:signal transduction histidine kinase
MVDANDNQQDQRTYIERAQQGINRLSQILTNMSEATRLEQAIQRHEKERFEVLPVLSGCCEGYRIAYPDHQFEFHGQGITHHLEGSPELFAQMLDKVITNAVEFSSPSTPIVVTCVQKSTQLMVTIVNQGPHLPENMHEQLLDSMISVRSQTNVAAEHQQTHLGLGLYIAKIIAEYHHGKISLNNTYQPDGVAVTLNF